MFARKARCDRGCPLELGVAVEISSSARIGAVSPDRDVSGACAMHPET